MKTKHPELDMIGLPRLKDELTMKFHVRQSIVWALLILSIPVYTQSQTKPAKKGPTSSVSGKVTIKGKGAAGIAVGLRAADYEQMRTSRYIGVTDQDGNYRITDVQPGTYQVMPAAPAYVFSGEPGGKTLIIAEGESVEGVDFALARGGVITGKVTESEGRPLIEETINLLPADTSNQSGPFYVSVRHAQTDDRGVYRFFGISAGKYRVAVGQSDDGSSGGRPRRSLYKQTFHPAVTNPAKASVIEVTEGSEATNVDITVGRTLDTFVASGRIVDGATGLPLPQVRFGVERIASEGSFSFISSSAASNSKGEFRIENLAPGKYAIFIVPQANANLRADAVQFDLLDQDVSGLLIKTSEGSTVSGVIEIANIDDKTAPTFLSRIELHAYVHNESLRHSRPQEAVINPDGSFRVGGLLAGTAQFSLALEDRRGFREFTIVRVERDGVDLPAGVEVKAGEHVTGIRIVVTYGTATVRGHIKVENGELPPTVKFSVWLMQLADDSTKSQRTSLPPAKVDSRGHFLVEGLAAGTYEVNANVFTPGMHIRTVKQQVNVSQGSVNEVVLTLDLTKTPANP